MNLRLTIDDLRFFQRGNRREAAHSSVEWSGPASAATDIKETT
jgi:hypothetical protein